MKILQLNCVYKEGSTGKIVDCIGEELRAQGHEVLTLYGNGKGYYDEYSKKICTTVEHNFNALLGRITGMDFGGIYLANNRIYKTIRKFQPDLVHVHCLNGFCVNLYDLLKYLAKNNTKTVVTLHAEIYHTAGCSHAYDCEQWKTRCITCPEFRNGKFSGIIDTSRFAWRKMYEAINSFNPENLTITAVSPWLAERAKQSTILKKFNIVYVPNGLDVSVFYYKDNKGLIDREQYKKVVLFVTPYFSHEELDLKGGKYLPTIADSLPEYKFIVVASRTATNLKPIPKNVQLMGRANGQDELAQLYSEADVTLLLSRRETFSMVTAESLCCGTPVVGFKAGGPESISIKEYSTFVEYGDKDMLKEKLLDNYEGDDKETISKQAIATYASAVSGNLYLDVYKALLNNK